MNKRIFAAGLGLLALCLAAGPLAAASAAELSICLAEDNAPFSDSAGGGEGIDFALGKELAQRLGRTLDAHWLQIPSRGGLGKALRRAFASGECELFAGIPLAEGRNDDLAEQRLAATAPYFATGYALVSARNGRVRSLADARAAARVGAVSATPADLYLFQQGLARRPFGSNEALLAALGANQVDAAVMWLPALARLTDRGRELWPEAVRPGEVDDPALKVAFVIALRAGGDLRAPALDDALHQIRADGSLARIAARYGLPAD